MQNHSLFTMGNPPKVFPDDAILELLLVLESKELLKMLCVSKFFAQLVSSKNAGLTSKFSQMLLRENKVEKEIFDLGYSYDYVLNRLRLCSTKSIYNLVNNNSGIKKKFDWLTYTYYVGVSKYTIEDVNNIADLLVHDNHLTYVKKINDILSKLIPIATEVAITNTDKTKHNENWDIFRKQLVALQSDGKLSTGHIHALIILMPMVISARAKKCFDISLILYFVINEYFNKYNHHVWHGQQIVKMSMDFVPEGAKASPGDLADIIFSKQDPYFIYEFIMFLFKQCGNLTNINQVDEAIEKIADKHDKLILKAILSLDAQISNFLLCNTKSTYLRNVILNNLKPDFLNEEYLKQLADHVKKSTDPDKLKIIKLLVSNIFDKRIEEIKEESRNSIRKSFN